MNLVFVYGTLQREFGNHRVMEYAGGEFVGNAQTMDKYPLIVDGLPYLLDSRGVGEHVQGEIYDVPDEGFTDLDRLEGHPSFYERRVRTFLLERTEEMTDHNSRTKRAWVYFLNSHVPSIEGRTLHKSYKDARINHDRQYAY